MKIGILGAPGAGKTQFAKRFSRALVKRGFTNVAIIDGVVDDLIKRTGYEFDIHATAAQNMQVVFHRWTKEQEAITKGAEHLLICGTIYEATLYTGLRVLRDWMYYQDREINAAGVSFLDTLRRFEEFVTDYDALVFLPYDEETAKEKGRSYATVINEKILEITDGYQKVVVPLRGTMKAKVYDGLRVVEAIEHWEASRDGAAQEQEVQRSSSSEQADQMGVDAVPNVSS